MWVIAVDAVVVLFGVGLLGLLAWRVVVRPGLALSRAVSAVATQAGDALSTLTDTQGAGTGVAVGNTPKASGALSPNEGMDVR